MKSTLPSTGYFPSFFDEFFNDFEWPAAPKRSVPSVNVKETDSGYQLDIAAPGMNKDDFNVELENDTLIISGEVKKEEMKEDERYTRKEFSYQSFKRSFRLPENAIDQDRIDAKYENGILKIQLPKMEQEAQKSAKRISIG